MSTASIPEWTLGWRLDRSLAHAGMTQQQMAEELGYVRTTINGWINEHGKPPRPGILKQWALRTGVPYEWLAYGTSDNTPPDLGNRTSEWKSDAPKPGHTSSTSRPLARAS